MYFIVNGLATVLHKKTQTYIKDLKEDDYFGEIGFFSDKRRQATVKARDFTELLELTYEGFIETAQDYPDALVTHSNEL